MENASKALIIAGAILLAILIISLGILVYQQAKGTVDDANLDSQEVQTFNEQIIQYCGNGKSASEMNALVAAINAANGAQVGDSSPHYITLKSTYSNFKNFVSTSTTSFTYTGSGTIEYPVYYDGYSFSATYVTDQTTGYISTVTIK